MKRTSGIIVFPLLSSRTATLKRCPLMPPPPPPAGPQCKVKDNECAPKAGSWGPKCQNGGQCMDGVGRYMCSCPPGFAGEHCEGDVNECLSGPCHAPGSLDCVQLTNDYQCRCRLGYTGTTAPRSAGGYFRNVHLAGFYADLLRFGNFEKM